MSKTGEVSEAGQDHTRQGLVGQGQGEKPGLPSTAGKSKGRGLAGQEEKEESVCGSDDQVSILTTSLSNCLEKNEEHGPGWWW